MKGNNMKKIELDVDLLFKGSRIWVQGYPFELPDLFNTYGPYYYDQFGSLEKLFDYIESINIHLYAIVEVGSHIELVLEDVFNEYLHERSL